MGRPWLSQYPPEVPPTLAYPDQPLDRFLSEAAARFPEQPALIFYGRRFSYRQVDAAANRFAALLANFGIRPGERVALLLPNCPQSVIAYYGALRAGAVIVQLSPMAAPREIILQLEDSGARTLVTIDLLLARALPAFEHGACQRLLVGRLADALPAHLRLLFPLKARREGQDLRIPERSGVFRWSDRADAPANPPQVTVRPDDLALIQYTGGTTGAPKGAMLTHRNLVANALQTAAWFPGVQPGRERILCVVPFFHVYGMTVCMNFGIHLAATLILLPRFDVPAVLAAIARHRPTLFPGVPTMYVALLNHPQMQRYDLRSITACISGAAPLPREVQERFEAITGGRLVEGYGLTEASPVTHANPLFGEGKPGSIGLPLPDTDCRIVDLEDGRELPAGQVGELLVRGPQVMKGYWNRPAETEQVLRDGWLRTGDVARMDEDGYFYIVDRIKDMIISGGLNVYPREVEEVLYRHPAVREAAVIGVPDAYLGEAVQAYVVLTEGASVDAEELRRYCREHLAAYKVPKTIEFRDELPKSLIGKVLRRALREETRA
ncbi:MAG TPA: long-chain fatty acid--CoA ligase [Bacillota bacterium]